MLSWIKDKIKGVKGQQDCIFCKIRNNPNNTDLNPPGKYLYEDDNHFVVHDISKASARQHILVLTKRHIRSALNIDDKNQLIRMKQIAMMVLKQLQQNHEEKNQKEIISKDKQQKQKYRFGFHLPPYNSIDHVHLHGFLLPIENPKYDKFYYGWVMTRVEELIK